MNRPQSIAALNEHWWYRLLKVLFALSFLLIAGLSVLVVYFSNNEKLVDDYQITCKYGNDSTFLASDKGIYSPLPSDSSDSPNPILQACAITASDIASAKSQAALKTQQLDNDTYCQNDPSSFLCGLSIDPVYFDAPETTILKSTTLKAVGYSIVDLIVVLILFEIVRRIFYYIIFGKFFPNKFTRQT